MTELIPHKIEIAAIDGCQRHQTNHLMESHASFHSKVIVVNHHVPIHLLIYKSEDYSLIAHKSLVMAFAIRDSLLIGTSVCQLPEYRSGMPILILLLLDHLNPIIRYTHSHTVVETNATISIFRSQTGHTAHLFSDGYSVRIHLMDKHIGKGKISYGISVLIAIIIVGIRTECLPKTVVII